MNRFQKISANGQRPLFLPASSWAPPELPRLRGRGIRRISIDVETRDPGLRTMGPGFRRGSYVVGLAVGIQDGPRFYLPTRHDGGGNLDERVVQEWAHEELDALENVEVVGTNLGYDLDALTSPPWNLTFGGVTAFHDVQVAEPLIDEWRDRYDLDSLSLDYLGEGKEETLLNEAATAFGLVGRDAVKENLWRFPANLVGPYAEGDVDRPLRIFPLQQAKLTAEGLEEVYGVERRLIPLLVRMRQRGVRVSEERAQALRRRLSLELREQEAELRRLAGPSAELSLPQTLAPALAERGIDVPRTAKTDVPSITKPFLERHAADPLVAAILRGRQLFTVINTFVDSQILGHAVNGRVHPTFRQLKGDDGGTIARLSGSNPNMQFIPARDEEIAPLVRSVFLPEESEDWQRDDQSQIEYRLLVDCAVGRGAEEARRKYREEPATDYHKFVAEMLGADPEDRVRRKRIKNTNFAKSYGAQVPKLAQTFGCSLEEAAEFVREYEEKLPFAGETFDHAAKSAQRHGHVRTVLGRRGRFPFWGPRGYRRERPGPLFRSREEAAEHWVGHDYGRFPVRAVERVNTYMALNRKLQGSGGDVMKKWMVDADRAGLTSPDLLGPFLVTVHDELGSSVPRTKRGDEAGRELKRIGEECVRLRVPLMVDSQRGESWGACK